MKKLYVLLLLTAHGTSISCMQGQQPLWYNFYSQQDGSDATTIPLQIITSEPAYTICTATQLEQDLTPIYRDTNRTASVKKQQEKEPLLGTISFIQPDITSLMQQLYNDTYEFISKENSLKGTNQFTQEKKLADLIKSINQAHSMRITEDVMGKFAYDNQRHIGGIVSVSTALFFNILKTYNAAVRVTNETLPFNKNQNDVYSAFQKHIAFFNAHHILKILLQEYTTETKHNLATCLYEDANVLFQYSQNFYTDVKTEFFKRAHNVLFSNGDKYELYELLPIIETTKTLSNIYQENHLQSGITDFEPTETIKEKIYNLFDAKHSANNKKDSIMLLCKFMKTYSDARGKKAIPTLKQFYAYQLQKNLNLALPDSFKLTIFNEDMYALAEFGQLLDNITDLIKPDNHNVQKCEKTWSDNHKIDYV
ncbi:MAG TPA: hypothetical protein VKR54_04625 [Candidatus Babeliales bacterium]|jgi:hypothetical protein|nr:hypothetical protein [Candidatus Babeliales bacterium]